MPGNLVAAQYDLQGNQAGGQRLGTPITIVQASNTVITAIIAAGAPADPTVWYQYTDTYTGRIVRYTGSAWVTVLDTSGSGFAPTVAWSGTWSGTHTFNGSITFGGSVTQTTSYMKIAQLQSNTFTDISGTPGNGTSNGMRGKAAFAAAASTVTITSSQVTATSSVFVQLESSDTTLTSILKVVPAAGSFTVTGNAAATAAAVFSFHVVN